MGCNSTTVSNEQLAILSTLTPIQLSIYEYLRDHGYSTRDKILSHLIAQGFFISVNETTGASRKLSEDYADRLMRREVLEMIFSRVPICTHNNSGYWLGTDDATVDKAKADLYSKSEALKLRAEALDVANHAWNKPNTPSPKISVRSWQRLHQLNLFDEVAQ